jgi:ABC-type bacteriocin/lantibiotic exporter with double-glycine peptidase domain
MELDDLRRSIGVVPQDTVLFNDTMLYNIAYGDLKATRTEIEMAARCGLSHEHNDIFFMAENASWTETPRYTTLYCRCPEDTTLW